MIISRTPYRVSLFGGSTDYKEFYRVHGGFLIGMAIDKYSYLSARKTPSILPYRSRFAYSKTEILYDNDFSQIDHNGIRGALEYLEWEDPIELSHFCDIPSQTGLGSSSSFVVGLVNVLQTLDGCKCSKLDLAQCAIDIEREILAEKGGIQDQIWAAYGGFNSIEITRRGEFKVKPLPISDSFTQKFISHSLLLYTGNQRNSFEIANHTSSSHGDKNKLLDLAVEAYDKFASESLWDIADLLDESWCIKRRLNDGISNQNIDKLYNQLRDFGMLGGKLLGAGGSGFIFGIFDHPIRANLSKLPSEIIENVILYDIDYSGSKIIYA